MSFRVQLLAVIALALSLFGICPSARCDDTTDLSDWVTSFISQHLNYSAESNTASGMQPEEAARALLDSLLNEDTIQPLLADYRLRRDFDRVAAYLRVPIANEFGKAVESEDMAMHERAMWWADGLMRLAPRDIGKPLAMMRWERAPRPWASSPVIAPSSRKKDLLNEYRQFLASNGVDIYSFPTVAMLASACYGCNYSPGNMYDDGALREGYWMLASDFWRWLYALNVYNDKQVQRSETDWSLVLILDSPKETDRFIRGTNYFRPYFVPAILWLPEDGWTKAETARGLIEGLLEVWDTWLSRH
jgi:hypothetical protein